MMFIVAMALLASMPLWWIRRALSSPHGSQAEQTRIFVYGMLCGVGAYIAICWLCLLKTGYQLCGLLNTGEDWLRNIFRSYCGNLNPSTPCGALLWVMLPLVAVYLYVVYAYSPTLPALSAESNPQGNPS